MAVALALMGFAGGIGLAGGLVLTFFVGYYVAYDPYRALYPTLSPRTSRGARRARRRCSAGSARSRLS
jgi:hypothetical protein